MGPVAILKTRYAKEPRPETPGRARLEVTALPETARGAPVPEKDLVTAPTRFDDAAPDAPAGAKGAATQTPSSSPLSPARAWPIGPV